jgi:restriction endonuclease S subunit
MELIKRGHDVTPVDINNPFSLTLMRSRCIFPLFSLTRIEDWKKQCELERGFGDNPCYSIKDDIVSTFKDITPDSEESIDIYHRAVHAFDLGVMLGFLTKKPKGRVYYFCEIKNDIESGFPIKGGSGGGRSKTKDWLQDKENRHYLEKLEQKIEAVLTNMAGETFKKFNEDWKVFKNKAANNSKKQSAWQSSDYRKLPDYHVGCNDPMVLRKVKDSKRL